MEPRQDPADLSPVDRTRLADGLHLPECPRWHDGALWISDMWGHEVIRFEPSGQRLVACSFDASEDPGGLGWMPDGSLLIVGMEGRRIYRMREDDRALSVHADLSQKAPGQCNDMIVRSDGTAYVSHFGYDFWSGGFRPASLIRVTPTGSVDIVADDLWAPNGMALTPDESTLFLSECGRSNVLAFELAEDGALSGRRVHAALEPVPGATVAPPDGICMDAEGCLWVAEPIGRRVLRVDELGRVVAQIAFEHSPLAVVLGGDERRTLYVCLAAEHHKPTRRAEALGHIDAIAVDVPGAGAP